MKRIITAAALVLVTAAAPAFANEPVVTERVKAAFEEEFGGASLLGWARNGDFYRATFMLAGTRTEAFFTPRGELAGSIRGVLYNQLPLAVVSSVEKRFTGIGLVELFEISNADGTSYLFTLESGNKQYRVRMDANGNMTGKERIRK